MLAEFTTGDVRPSREFLVRGDSAWRVSGESGESGEKGDIGASELEPWGVKDDLCGSPPGVPSVAYGGGGGGQIGGGIADRPWPLGLFTAEAGISTGMLAE